MVACALVFSWAITGPVFGFSSTWQLIINTGTTIATFLMIFLLQNTQNRDSAALQVKLDEIIRAIGPADNRMLDVEEADQKDLDKARQEYRTLAEDEIEAANGGPRQSGREQEPARQ
jgi:low affinity Fe/Cu permease